MATATSSTVYIRVIEDVINKVRDEFIGNGGPGEAVLLALQGSWEKRMMEAGEILGPIDRTSIQRAGADGPITPKPVRDLNVPYEGTEEYETPTADLLFPPTPMPGSAQTPLPGSAQTPLPGIAQTPLPGTTPTPFSGSDSEAFYNIPTGDTPNEYTSNNENGGLPDIRAVPGRPSSYMQAPSAWTNQRHPLDVNVAYDEGREEVQREDSHQQATQDFFMPSGKRKRGDALPQQDTRNTSNYLPQQDGAGDNLSDELKEAQSGTQQMFVQGGTFSSRIPQLDGQLPDPYDEMLSTPNIYNYQGVVNEDYNIANTPLPPETQAVIPAPIQNDAGDDDDDEPLNEDDDDDLDEDDGEGQNIMHLILAQFDKVTRTKSRWKCTLKNGIMHINNKDILFNKATGEFDF